MSRSEKYQRSPGATLIRIPRAWSYNRGVEDSLRTFQLSPGKKALLLFASILFDSLETGRDTPGIRDRGYRSGDEPRIAGAAWPRFQFASRQPITVNRKQMNSVFLGRNVDILLAGLVCGLLFAVLVRAHYDRYQA